MTNRGNTQALEVLDRQMAQVFSTDAIRVECRLIALKPEILQPSPDIHRRFPWLGDACDGLSDRDATSVQAKKASAASEDLRLTVEEGVWPQHRRQIPALDVEQPGKTERP